MCLIDDDDLVSLLHSGQSVGDQNHTFAVEILVDGLLNASAFRSLHPL